MRQNTAFDQSSIDVVITWVDGGDPDHIKLREQYSHESAAPTTAEVNAPRRWSYANELDICLRSIDLNAPWIRKIFIVTNGQVPQALDALPQSLQNKIAIIDHKVIFAGYENWLPTFNSMAIVAMLWRIPDLSERFILFNDDVFLGSPCSPALFFNNDETTLFGRWMSLSEPKLTKFKKSIYRITKLNAAQAMGYNPQRFFSTAHVAIPMRVSVMKAIFSEHPNLLERNGSARFRHSDQYLASSLFTHYVLKTGKANIARKHMSQNLSSAYCKKVPYWVFYLNCMLMRLFPKRFRLICVNDLSRLNERFRGKASRIIRKTIGID